MIWMIWGNLQSFPANNNGKKYMAKVTYMSLAINK